MVRIQGPSSDPDRLDGIVAEAVRKHGFRLDVEGWTRKTYDVYAGQARNRDSRLRTLG